MKFSEQIGIAFALSLAGASFVALGSLVGGAFLKPMIALLAAVYAGYLMWRSSVRIGRVIVGFAFLIATVLAASLLSIGWFILSQVIAVWLIRCLYVHSRPWVCLADLGLVAIACGAAVWAFGSGSVFLTLWTFFLVQGLFVLVPEAGSKTRAHVTRTFAEAKAEGEAALHKLLARN